MATNGEASKTSWLEGIMKAAAELPVEGMADEDEVVVPTDKVIGTIPDNLVRIRRLSLQFADKVDALNREHAQKFGPIHVHVGPRCQAFNAECGWLERQAVIVSKIFWVSVVDHFNVQNKNLALRKGNVLVETAYDHGDSRESRISATIVEIPVSVGFMAALAGLGGGQRKTRES